MDDSRRRDKRRRVDDPPVADLNRLARELRAGPAGQPAPLVPWFDPDSAGVATRILVLMEAPGPRQIAAGDLAFSSEENDDPTAAALRAARATAGLGPTDYLRWNVVPWALLDPDGRPRPPRATDLAAAAPALTALLGLLPDLALVVAVGAPALSGTMRVLTGPTPPLPPNRVPRVLGVPHPSPRNARQRGEARDRLARALRVGRGLLT